LRIYSISDSSYCLEWAITNTSQEFTCSNHIFKQQWIQTRRLGGTVK